MVRVLRTRNSDSRVVTPTVAPPDAGSLLPLLQPTLRSRRPTTVGLGADETQPTTCLDLDLGSVPTLPVSEVRVRVVGVEVRETSPVAPSRVPTLVFVPGPTVHEGSIQKKKNYES